MFQISQFYLNFFNKKTNKMCDYNIISISIKERTVENLSLFLVGENTSQLPL